MTEMYQKLVGESSKLLPEGALQLERQTRRAHYLRTSNQQTPSRKTKRILAGGAHSTVMALLTAFLNSTGKRQRKHTVDGLSPQPGSTRRDGLRGCSRRDFTGNSQLAQSPDQQTSAPLTPPPPFFSITGPSPRQAIDYFPQHNHVRSAVRAATRPSFYIEEPMESGN
jgi:hypothetical protein